MKTQTLIADLLDKVACDTIGLPGIDQWYFVSVNGKIDTITSNPLVAENRFEEIKDAISYLNRPEDDVSLEDSVAGVMLVWPEGK